MQLNVGYYSNIVDNVIFDSFIPRRQSELINYLNFLFFTISNRYRLQVDKFHGVEFEEDISTINFYLDDYDLERIRNLLKSHFSVCNVSELYKQYTTNFGNDIQIEVASRIKETLQKDKHDLDKTLIHDDIDIDDHLFLMDKGELVCLLKFVNSPKHSTRNIFTTGLRIKADYSLIDVPYNYGNYSYSFNDSIYNNICLVFFYDSHIDNNVVPSERICNTVNECLSDMNMLQQHFKYFQSYEGVSARYENNIFINPLPEITPLLYKMDSNYYNFGSEKHIRSFKKAKEKNIEELKHMLMKSSLVISSYSWITHLCKLYNIPHITYYDNYYGSNLHKQLNLITQTSQPIDNNINKLSLKNKIDWILDNASNN